MGDIGRQDALTGGPVARSGRLDSARFEALRARMQAASATPSQLRAHPRAADGEPCSCEQARAWFLEQWEGSSALYHVVSRWRLDGTLDEAALQQALDALVARHESLRTGFPAVDGEPVQRIAAHAHCPLERIAAAEADAHAQRPFDLEQPPLLRAALWRANDGAQRLQLVTHHIVSDGWSQGVLQRELGALYAAALRGDDAALPPLPLQYADFAHWQRARLHGSAYDALLGYWRDTLAGLPQLALPTDRPRPAQPDYRGATLDFRLDAALTGKVRALSRRHGCSLYMVLLAAFKLLLARWSGQNDVVVGTPVAGRGQPELDHLIGFFANTLVLRSRLDLQAGVADLLDRVRTSALGAFDHAAMPFEKLVEELKPPRDPGRNPLFQVMFALRNAPRSDLQLPGVAAQPQALRSDIAKFDLTLELSERDDCIDAQIEYACALFDATTAVRMADHYRRLLEGMVTDDGLPAGRLPMYADGEAGVVDVPADATLASMFAQQVARSPDAPALACGDRVLSYAALNAHANRLAHRLRALGVGPDRCVAVCMTRSFELVIALVAIQKAGGAYLPIDPDYPDARIDYMLDDTEAPVLLTQRTLGARFAARAATVICLDADDCADMPAHDLAPSAGPRDLAYVIYTSGSTGQPKGVMIEHAAICNHMHWMLATFGFDASDRVLQKTGISADASVWELLAPLFCGACMVLAEPGSQRDPSSLVRQMQAQRITVMQVVPSLLRALLTEPGFAACTALRQMFCGGEALEAPVVAAFFARSTARLHNLYGPTEAAIDATWWTCDGAPGAQVPIGRPISNMQAYVLDEAMQPVPAGVAGELYLGGIGLARAYLGKPALTAERFVTDPFDPRGGARLYRTGDSVIRRADGALVFVGRVDHQIKLRGFRIEPGEIEAALCADATVEQAVVVAREERLVAYVTGAGHRPDAAALRQRLQRSLPAHLVPAAIVVLDALPLTPHGKLDRSALPQPDSAAVGDDSPRTPLECELAALWAEVLGLPAVGARDSFFDLGGHSLLAARLATRLRARFGIDVPLGALLDAPSVQAMARWLDGRTAVTANDTATLHALFEVQAARTPDAVALVHAGRTLRYGELNARANRIAHALRRRGVGADTPVGVQLELSCDLVAAVLGVLKAGGAYLPLDTRNPPARTLWMLADAGATLLLTTRTAALSEAPGVTTLQLEDEDWLRDEPIHDPEHDPEHNPEHDGTADTLAYVLYTSGSTGTPKGVMVGHAAIGNRMRWLVGQFGIGAGDAMLAHASIGFDVSVGQLFACLIAGGRCVLAGDALRSDAAALIELSRHERVTLWDFTPALLRLLLDEPALPECRALRHVFCGGEAMDAALARTFRARCGAALHNMYGPTEAAIDATFWTCTDSDGDGPPPIGHPIANASVWVLDERMQPLPIGVEGELYIGGAGLARGYIGRPELTAERFLPHPFDPTPGARLYRTGDRVRRRADGALMFAGRADHQIKLNGVRIEPGEIEAALTALPGVRQAAVMAQADGQRLVAWAGGRDLDAAALRTGLARTLPAHMLPSAIVVLEQLPLTANGKIDRKALPSAPGDDTPDAHTGPRTPLQQTLAELWADALGRRSVGIDDDFFALGGHSLLAARLVSRLRKLLDQPLPLRALFEAPTVAAMAARLEALRDDASPAHLIMQPSTGALETACAHAQAGLWFIERMGASGGLYHIVNRWRIAGALDLDALQRALDALLARQSALRTGFVEREGRPHLHIDAAARCVVERIAAADADAHAERPFDLAQPPLLRVALWRDDEGAEVLQTVIHHIISDGWSQAVLNRELGALYAAARHGGHATLPALPLQYADYARWQRALLDGPAGERLLGYWRRQLDGLGALELPTDRPRPKHADHRGGSVDFALDASLTAALRALARRTGCTLYMVLLAAFQLLLARWGGQDDIAVGTPVAGRAQPELDHLIGFFTDTLVLRTRIDVDADVRALLEQVRATSLGAFEHAELPFDRLVEALRPQREGGRNPLFQVMFVLQNAPAETLTLTGASTHALPAARPVAKFDLTLDLTETADGLAAQFAYATALFDRGTLERMAGHYRQLLAAMVADEGSAVGSLLLLTPAERQRLLIDRNDTVSDYPAEATLASLFEARVRQAPDAPALISGEQVLSYGELNARANRLAHRLRALGVGPDCCVGLCIARSVELVVGALAIVKAGGAYVPLDPAWPAARIARLLGDTRSAWVVAGHEGDTPLDGLAVQVLHADDATLQAEPASDPPPLGNSRSLAYVIYTSGSTGQPKGVMVEQRSIARLVFGCDYAHFGPDETFLLLAPMAFDASTFELWGALLHGARCVIHPEAAATAAGLEATIERHGVSTLWLTAALFNAVIDERPTALRGLRQLLTGGEALSLPHVKRALAALPGVALINGYGPTESTTFTCCQRIPNPLPEDWAAIPIGRPIANTTVYILDARGQPVPDGVEGELYIGGAGLARGYIGAPTLTAERFVAPAFADCPDARLYRTGDRVRWRHDGSIAFVGRNDQQIKLRGFRIEPGEIEAALAALPGVNQAAVMLRTAADGERRLFAWASGERLDGAALRAQLAQTLPEFMLPSAVIALERMPVTANGKLDRAALPAPDAVHAPRTRRAPTDAAERHLLAIWESLFGRDGLSTDDDFFAIGGHSLLAVRLVDAIERTFGVRLPLDTFWFRGNTIRDIAGLLRGAGAPLRWPVLVPIRPGGTRRPLFCVHTIGGNLFHYYELAKALPEGQPVMGLNAVGVGGAEPARSRIADIAADCVSAMRSAQPAGPYRLLGFSSGGTVAYEMAQQLRAAGEQVDFLGLLDTWAPGTYQRAPDGSLFDRLIAPVRPYTDRRRLQHLVCSLTGLSPRRFPDAASAHWWAHWSYRPATYPGRVDLYVADASRLEASAPCLGWSSRVTGPLVQHPVEGSHGLMVKPPRVHEIAQMLRQRLDELDAATD
ncbi:MAG: amino acid adenylation domain-containing protein [Methyloversatilis discipulorum]|uniref:non-ribosomal peptide synthetase n=1 Tax=Methyloversatilis discipulorum TaxID=1119528 RepID=UPI0026EB1988|nr:non-ribosomal peptide synthetase [Methyloversatilis discipulorum]MBT9518643.1 amino acid adenylation domain-containing protein [Methyloversatilis discipulorum]